MRKLTFMEMEEELEALQTEQLSYIKGGYDEPNDYPPSGGYGGSDYYWSVYNLLGSMGIYTTPPAGSNPYAGGYSGSSFSTTFGNILQYNPNSGQWGYWTRDYIPHAANFTIGDEVIISQTWHTLPAAYDSLYATWAVNYGGYGSGYSGSGGSYLSYQISSDCVLKCLDYLDGSENTYATYYSYAAQHLGFTSASGGINTGDIPTLGAAGYLNVYNVNSPYLGINSSTGKRALTGESLMMTFNSINGADHAVVVTGVQVENGIAYIKYFDPTINDIGRQPAGEYSGMYAVSPL